MYITKRLSEYQRNRSELPESPNSGVLIIQDEESKPTCCFGSCYESGLKGLPFPQNAKLTVNYSITVNNVTTAYRDPVVFIPVLDQPLSSNRYYAIKRSGKHSGEASANERKTESPVAFASAMYLKLNHKQQILMTYTNNSRFINQNHYLEITMQHPLLLTGYHQSSSRENIGQLSTQHPKIMV